MIVEYIDHMGSDLAVVNAARVSFGKRKTELDDKDVKLIRYLAEHGHMSPFRHCIVKVRIECPIFVERQITKHQVGVAVNSISGRYVQFEEHYWSPETFRKADKNVKQGSSNELFEGIEASTIASKFEAACHLAFVYYQDLVDHGVCREQARAVLPLATFTQFIMTASLQAWWNFYRQRSDPHAQAEIRVYAAAIDTLMAEYFPVSWQALKEVGR